MHAITFFQKLNKTFIRYWIYLYNFSNLFKLKRQYFILYMSSNPLLKYIKIYRAFHLEYTVNDNGKEKPDT